MATNGDSMFKGTLVRSIRGEKVAFDFWLDTNDTGDGAFLLPITNDERIGVGICDYIHSSTTFAADIHGLYLLGKKWSQYKKEYPLNNFSDFKFSSMFYPSMRDGVWGSLECFELVPKINYNLRPDYISKWNALAFRQYFEGDVNITYTCISWGTDQVGALEVLEEISATGIIRNEFEKTQCQYFDSCESYYEHIISKVVDFFKPINLRLTEKEFREIPRRVMGRPLKKELNLEEFPNCPICLDVIGSRQHCKVLKCAHLMHIACARQWLIKHCTKPNCPCCRASTRPIIESETTEMVESWVPTSPDEPWEDSEWLDTELGGHNELGGYTDMDDSNELTDVTEEMSSITSIDALDGEPDYPDSYAVGLTDQDIQGPSVALSAALSAVLSDSDILPNLSPLTDEELDNQINVFGNNIIENLEPIFNTNNTIYNILQNENSNAEQNNQINTSVSDILEALIEYDE